MDFQEVLRKRRSVRAYLPDEIPTETIGRIIDTARRHPQQDSHRESTSWSLRNLEQQSDSGSSPAILSTGIR